MNDFLQVLNNLTKDGKITMQQEITIAPGEGFKLVLTIGGGVLLGAVLWSLAGKYIK